MTLASSIGAQFTNSGRSSTKVELMRRRTCTC
jgi:hypothetical protein